MLGIFHFELELGGVDRVIALFINVVDVGSGLIEVFRDDGLNGFACI